MSILFTRLLFPQPTKFSSSLIVIVIVVAGHMGMTEFKSAPPSVQLSIPAFNIHNFYCFAVSASSVRPCGGSSPASQRNNGESRQWNSLTAIGLMKHYSSRRRCRCRCGNRKEKPEGTATVERGTPRRRRFSYCCSQIETVPSQSCGRFRSHVVWSVSWLYNNNLACLIAVLLNTFVA